MKMQYYIAIIETDTEKLNEKTGAELVRAMGELKGQVDEIGSCEYYQVTDPSAPKVLAQFREDIKRLNP